MKIRPRKAKVCKWMSEETTCFEAEIVIDGKVAGHVSNEGHGGDNNYHFKDRAVEVAFEAYCKAMPPVKSEVGDLPMDMDLYVDQLLEAYEMDKQLRRWCKKQTVFRLPGDEEGSYRTLKRTPYGSKAKEWVMKKYPNAEIINERFAA